MEPIIEEKGLDVVVHLQIYDIVQANMLRRAIFHIPTWGVGYVTFYKNSTSRNDEVLALLLGLLPIDNTNLELHDDTAEYRYTIRETGPKVVTSDDIDGLPFVHTHPFVTLLEKQEIHCDLILVKDSGKTHAKWLPTACLRVDQDADTGQCKLLFKTKKMLSSLEIINSAYAHMNDAENAKPFDIFSKPLVHPFEPELVR